MNTSTHTNRFEGRLFTQEGHLCMVIGVDDETGLARVSYRADGEQQIMEMPISEIGMHLASNQALVLDGLGNESKKSRIVEQTDGWFFQSRGGMQGPFQTEAAAEHALNQHIVSSQDKNQESSERSVAS